MHVSFSKTLKFTNNSPSYTFHFINPHQDVCSSSIHDNINYHFICFFTRVVGGGLNTLPFTPIEDEDIVTISDRACKIANGRGRQVQPNAGAAGFLRGTVVAENACRAHNEARQADGEKSSRKGTKSRQAIGMAWGNARPAETAVGGVQ